MPRGLPLALMLVALMLAAGPADAQSPPPQPSSPTSRNVRIGGYGMVGRINLTAADTFKATIGKESGPIYGGGATVGLPLGGLYVDVGAWRFKQDGERVFVHNDEVFPLGIPLTVTLTTVEVTAGWRFRRGNSRLVPYVGAGFSAVGYQETSSFAESGEDADDRFNGYHVAGGADYQVMRWIALGGEIAWTTIPDAIGTAGASKAFGETELGGTTFRARLTIGR